MRPYMRAANVTWQGIAASDVKEMDFTPDEQHTYGLKRGDILLSEASGSASEVGKPAIWRDEVPGACFQNTLIRVRARDAREVPYLYWHFMYDAISGRFANGSRGTGIHHLGAKAMDEWPITIPSLEVQRRIVTAIETQLPRLDAAFAWLKRAKANVKHARASVLKAAVEGRLVHTEAALARAEHREYEPASTLLASILSERRARGADSGTKGASKLAPPSLGTGELPNGWAWSTVEQLASDQPRAIQSGPFGSSLLHSEFQSTGKLVIGIDNIQDGFFSRGSGNRISEAKFEQLSKYVARPLDLAITVMATIGRCCVIPAAIESAIITKHVYRITLDHRLCAPDYIAAVIRSPFGREKMLMESKGQTRPGLNGTIIKAFPVPLPPLAEQRRIVAEVERRLSVLDALAATFDVNLARCARLRQSILKRAFEGRLVKADVPGTGAPQLPLFTEEATR